jgi:hypothetical protein
LNDDLWFSLSFCSGRTISITCFLSHINVLTGRITSPAFTTDDLSLCDVSCFITLGLDIMSCGDDDSFLNLRIFRFCIHIFGTMGNATDYHIPVKYFYLLPVIKFI